MIEPLIEKITAKLGVALASAATKDREQDLTDDEKLALIVAAGARTEGVMTEDGYKLRAVGFHGFAKFGNRWNVYTFDSRHPKRQTP